MNNVQCAIVSSSAVENQFSQEQMKLNIDGVKNIQG